MAVPKKELIYVAGGVVAVYLIIKAILKDKDTRDLEKIKDLPSGDGSTQAMVGNLVFTEAMANNAADFLYSNMSSLGVDEDAVINYLSRPFNGKALQMIYTAYGLRSADGTGWFHTAFPKYLGGEPQDLGTWLNLEFLDMPSELDVIRSIFSKANIVI